MPTYDYVCESCGHELEMFQPMNSEPERVCPECKAEKLKRQIGSGGGVIFKGSGFYETDYRSASYKKGAAADSTPPKSSDSGGCSKAGGCGS